LDVLGDGPEKKKYINLAEKLNIKKRVRFLGHLRKSEALARLRGYDIFVFTSLQDMMGQALSEAMQLGLPCVVMDWGGPRALAGKNGAARVEVSTFHDTCKNLADKISELSSDTELRCRLAKEAKERIMNLTDSLRLNELRDRIYAECLKNTN
jgi:glycosyltransferase involved in cell wall biosynthesis